VKFSLGLVLYALFVMCVGLFLLCEVPVIEFLLLMLLWVLGAVFVL